MDKINSLGQNFYQSLEDKIIYIDSNIFMDGKFRNILEDFEAYKLNIVIPKEQYDELYNLKQNSDEEKKKLARDSFKLIEKFLDLRILKIEDINNDKMKQNAYADSVFIQKIANDLKLNRPVVFFTNDADLRIRIKSLGDKNNQIKLYGYTELKELSIKEEERIRDEEYQEWQKQHKAEEERKSNRSTSQKIIDGAKTVAKGVGIVVATGIAIALSSDA